MYSFTEWLPFILDLASWSATLQQTDDLQKFRAKMKQ